MRPLVSALACAVVASGCYRTVPLRQTLEYETPRPADEPAPARRELEILSAHVVVENEPSLGRPSAIAVVFSGDIDPLSLLGSHFLVGFSDGTRAVAEAAVLAPASEGDENRTALVLGNFADSPERKPTEITIIGPLYSEAGLALFGVSAPVTAFDAPLDLVTAERMIEPDDCAKGKQVVRTYWTDPLRGLEPADAAAVAIVLADGRTVHPVAFADHAIGADQSTDDNVLDLCIEDDAPARGITIAAGLLQDPVGHPNGPIEAPIDEPHGERAPDQPDQPDQRDQRDERDERAR